MSPIPNYGVYKIEPWLPSYHYVNLAYIYIYIGVAEVTVVKVQWGGSFIPYYKYWVTC